MHILNALDLNLIVFDYRPTLFYIQEVNSFFSLSLSLSLSITFTSSVVYIFIFSLYCSVLFFILFFFYLIVLISNRINIIIFTDHSNNTILKNGRVLQ